MIFELQICGQQGNIDYSSMCDSAKTQIDLNDCSYRQFLKLDSIINGKFDCINNYLVEQILKSENTNDSTMVKYYKNIEFLLNKSQDSWIELLNANLDFYYGIYKGGSIYPFARNSSAIIDAKDRIRRLDDFIVTLSQGNNENICK